MVNSFIIEITVLKVRIHYSLYHNCCIHQGHRQKFDFLSSPEANFLPNTCREQIVEHLRKIGILNDDESEISLSSSEGLLLLARDFVDRPEVFSSLLMSDFGFPPLVAHQTRALAMVAIRNEIRRNNDDDEEETNNNLGIATINNKLQKPTTSLQGTMGNAIGSSNKELLIAHDSTKNENKNDVKVVYSDKEFRSTIVNERARKRKRSVNDYNYGLPKNYANKYPKLALELEEYYIFMTQPTTYSQESPITHATGKIYMIHAKLFLGWFCQKKDEKENSNDEEIEINNNAIVAVAGAKPISSTTSLSNSFSLLRSNDSDKNEDELSLFDVVPNKEKESANDIITFVLWLRSRDVSVSYEANILRGIIKLLKFRFAKESLSDPLDGKNSFDDIPIIKEVRKLHRHANQRQRIAPRSSDESKKWITWEDYLGVTRNTKNKVLEMIQNYELLSPSRRKYAKGDKERIYSLEKIRIAEAYQRYLILAAFASIPDRQRTIRELEVGRTLIKDSETDCWLVKHGPSDYKTGKHYGERPALQLAEELTPAIDDFIANWRPALHPSTNILLVQSRTGKPMTGNSIFKRVVRCCFKYTGKSVNPHLLRDIIVTHVRETEASEKELEALALYMGHSIQMQRSSYDRRTLSTKIAPAVVLIKSLNKLETSGY